MCTLIFVYMWLHLCSVHVEVRGRHALLILAFYPAWDGVSMIDFSLACGRLASLWPSVFFGLCPSSYYRNTGITGLTTCPTLVCIWRIHTQVLRLEGQILVPTHCWATPPPALKMRHSTHPPCHCFVWCVSLVVLTSSVVTVADLQPVLM